MATALYLLRSQPKAAQQRFYLSRVATGGKIATFDPKIAGAIKFSAEQREKFQNDYPHIKGRWVRLCRELARGAAHG